MVSEGDKWGKGSKLFAVRVTTRQELSTALMLDEKWRKTPEIQRSSVSGIMVIDEVKSYIFVEAKNATDVSKFAYGFKHIKGRAPGLISYSEIEHFVRPKLAAMMIRPGDIVEIISGPFKGMKGRVEDVDKNKNEVKLVLLEASYTFPLTISAEYVKVVAKGGE